MLAVLPCSGKQKPPSKHTYEPIGSQAHRHLHLRFPAPQDRNGALSEQFKNYVRANSPPARSPHYIAHPKLGVLVALVRLLRGRGLAFRSPHSLDFFGSGSLCRIDQIQLHVIDHDMTQQHAYVTIWGSRKWAGPGRPHGTPRHSILRPGVSSGNVGSVMVDPI